MKRVIISILATLALTGAVFVAGASGHTVKYASSVTIKFNKAGKNPTTDPATFDGAVSSQTPRCQANRSVELRLRATDGSSSVVATDLTDSLGAWVIQPTTAAPGTYFAQAAKKVLRKDSKHRHICAKAISKTVTVK